MTTETRVEQLERRCRNLTRFNFLVLAAIGIALFCGAGNVDVFKQVKTEKLEIVDENGNVRIRLGPADEGYGVVIYDETGKFRASLTDAPLGTGLQLRKEGGDIKLFSFRDGAGISVRDADGKPRAVISNTKEGALIRLLDENGKTQFSSATDEKK